MTSYAHVNFPSEHPGVVRAERFIGVLKQAATAFDGARATATLLLAAIVSALLVVANQVIDTWSEGHLLAAWIVMWTVAFAAIGLLASPARRVAQGVRSGLRAASRKRRQAEADRKLWEVALTDARIMADISRAMSAAASRDVKPYF
jgi:hypothetical protein